MAKFKDINLIPGIIKTMKQIAKKRIEVGILGKDSEVAKIAAANEFGTDRAGRSRKVIIPERAFLRKAFDNKKSIKRVFDAVDQIFVIPVKPKTVLKAMALIMKGQVIISILSNIPPPNAPSTLRQKKQGKGRTLVNFGDLRKKIDFAII